MGPQRTGETTSQDVPLNQLQSVTVPKIQHEVPEKAKSRLFFHHFSSRIGKSGRPSAHYKPKIHKMQQGVLAEQRLCEKQGLRNDHPELKGTLQKRPMLHKHDVLEGYSLSS